MKSNGRPFQIYVEDLLNIEMFLYFLFFKIYKYCYYIILHFIVNKIIFKFIIYNLF